MLDKYLNALKDLEYFIRSQEALIINHGDTIDMLLEQLKEKDEIIKNLEAHVEELEFQLKDRGL